MKLTTTTNDPASWQAAGDELAAREENVSATLTVAVPAARVFAVLADPTTHAAIDGTGWVREAVGRAPLSEVGQLFRMDMLICTSPNWSIRWFTPQTQVSDLLVPVSEPMRPSTLPVVACRSAYVMSVLAIEGDEIACEPWYERSEGRRRWVDRQEQAMRRAGSMSWRISVDRWSWPHDIALWFRAAERIQVGAEGVVPGPLDVEPLPDRRMDPSDAAELAEGWLAWWRSLVIADSPTLPLDPSDPPAALLFAPPAFSGLHGFPALQQAVVGRWAEADRWHNARKLAGLAGGLHRDERMSAGQVVAEIENELGRKVRSFSLDLVLLPVHDDEIRPVGPYRYLVPERVYDGSRWRDLLRSLVSPIA